MKRSCAPLLLQLAVDLNWERWTTRKYNRDLYTFKRCIIKGSNCQYYTIQGNKCPPYTGIIRPGNKILKKWIRTFWWENFKNWSKKTSTLGTNEKKIKMKWQLNEIKSAQKIRVVRFCGKSCWKKFFQRECLSFGITLKRWIFLRLPILSKEFFHRILLVALVMSEFKTCKNLASWFKTCKILARILQDINQTKKINQVTNVVENIFEANYCLLNKLQNRIQ